MRFGEYTACPYLSCSRSERGTTGIVHGWLRRFALGSFIEEYCNVVRIVRLDEKGEFQQCCQLDHPYPATNVMWKPSKDTSGKDLLATTGDYLRIWCVSESGNDVRMESLLNNVRRVALLHWLQNVLLTRRIHLQNKSNEYCAPLTSFDWCTADPSLIATSSIDTTCTVWDINVRC